MRQSFLRLTIASAAILIIVSAGCSPRSRGPRLIGVIQFVHHPLLDETHRGLVAGLQNQGLNDGRNYVVRTQVADKNVQLAAQIIRQFLDQDAALIVAIATPAAQAAAAQTSSVPIVFAAITDPVAAKLVDSLDHPGHNLTGTSNRWPFEKQLALIPQVLPTARRIAAVWNPGEVNSQAAMAAIRPLATKAGLTLVEVPVASTADVALAATSVAEKADAFLMIPDNTVLAATGSLVNVCLEARKPLIGGDRDTVKQGSLATYGYDYYELGLATAEMAGDILVHGRKPAALPVRFPPTATLVVNQKTASVLGITLPQSLLQSATDVVR